MHNVKSNNLTADMLTENLKETVDQFITSNEAFGIINSIKGTPAYLKKLFTWSFTYVQATCSSKVILTLSCADLMWNGIISIISKLDPEELSDEDVINLSYHERWIFLNINPVLVTRHFQLCVEVFFKK